MEEYKHFGELQIDRDEEEIHLLRIPKGIDPNILLHARLDLTKKCKVKTQSETFHLEPISDKLEPTYFLGPNGLNKIEPLSLLLLTKSDSKKNIKEHQNHSPQLEEENKEGTVIPIDLIKEKHPLFGDKYKARIELQDEIKQKLVEAIQSFDKEESNSKQNKKQVVDNEEYDDKSLMISQILEAKFKRNSKHKRENSFQEHNVSHLKDSASVEYPIPLQKENEILDIKKVLQSDTQNSEGISNIKKKKKRHIESEESISKEKTEEISGNLQFDVDNVVHKDKKKKKRNSKQGEENSFQDKNIANGIMINDVSHLKDLASVETLIPSTRKVHENIYVDIKKELQSDAENLEGISNNKKKKKKHIESEESISIEKTEELSGNLQFDVDHVVHKDKKKRKRNSKQGEENSFQDKNIANGIMVNDVSHLKDFASVETLIPSTRKVHENIYVDIKKELQSDAENLEGISNNKKKKKKHIESEESISIEKTEELSGNLQFDVDNVVHKDKKKKKRNSKQGEENSFQDKNIESGIMINDVSHLKDFASVETLIPSTRKVHENIYVDIKKELQSDAENLENIPNKKKKKNGRRENGIISVNMKEESVSYLESSSEGKKKKKQRDLEQSVTIQPENAEAYSNICIDIKKEIQSDAENLASSLKEKTKKKKKHKNEHSSVTNSSIYLENMNYENMSIDIKKELQSDHENLESTPNERKKKRRRDSEASFPSLDFNNSFMPTAKKRRPSILSSTVIKESTPEFKPNLSAILGN